MTSKARRCGWVAAFGLTSLLAGLAAFAADAIDWDRAKQLHQKSQRGEALTAEEQAYLDRAKAAIAAGQGPRQAAAPSTSSTSASTPLSTSPQGGNAIDWNRATQLYQKSQRGEALSAEDQAYLDRAKAARGQGNQPGAAPQPAGGRATTGMTPLTDLGDGRYKGEDGGLYGGGRNVPPEEHRKSAEKELARIQPLDADGKSAATGKIVLVSIGMSNTTMEFSRFKSLADRDGQKSASVAVVDGAQGGMDAAAWAGTINGPMGNRLTPWAGLDQRLKNAGISAAQVQAVWLKQAEAGPARYGEFPGHARKLQEDVAAALTELKKRFPNLRIAYLSSRIYAGYASTQLNPEPYAYEGAFAMRWLIQSQIKGDAALNCDPAKGEVRAPLLLWGPYLWADGTAGRKADALKYDRADLGADGTHPGESGRQKVADFLLAFFRTDPLAKGWFVKAGSNP